MKLLKITSIVLGCLLLIFGTGYLYASSGISSKPGFADMTPKGVESHTAMLSVKVGPGGVKPVRWLLEQVAKNSNSSDVPEKMLRSALYELQGVQLRVYDSTHSRDEFDSAVSQTAAALKQKNWQTLMTVRDDEEHIVVMQYLDQDRIAGLSIMASTTDTAFFLNLIGPFDVESISENARRL